MNGPTVTDYRNPQYISEDLNCVDLEINTEEDGWIPTTIHLNDDDTQPHIVQIKEWLQENTGLIAAYVPPTAEDIAAGQAAEVRYQRDQRIKEADILVFKAEDRGVDPTIYRAYREALRNVTEQEGFPSDVSWPVAPPEPVAEAA